MRNKLIFSKDGDIVWIQFTENSRSEFCSTKEEAFDIILGFFDEGWISEQEQEDFVFQISTSETLPSDLEDHLLENFFKEITEDPEIYKNENKIDSNNIGETWKSPNTWN